MLSDNKVQIFFLDALSGGERHANFGVIDIDGPGMLMHPEREEIGFERGNPVKTPSGIGKSLDQLFFKCALGFEIVEEKLGLALVGSEILCGHDDGMPGESVAKRIERRALFARVGARAGGVLGIGAIDGSASGRWMIVGDLWMGARLSVVTGD
jgi:hypothetical protein